MLVETVAFLTGTRTDQVWGKGVAVLPNLGISISPQSDPPPVIELFLNSHKIVQKLPGCGSFRAAARYSRRLIFWNVTRTSTNSGVSRSRLHSHPLPADHSLIAGVLDYPRGGFLDCCLVRGSLPSFSFPLMPEMTRTAPFPFFLSFFLSFYFLRGTEAGKFRNWR